MLTPLLSQSSAWTNGFRRLLSKTRVNAPLSFRPIFGRGKMWGYFVSLALGRRTSPASIQSTEWASDVVQCVGKAAQI